MIHRRALEAFALAAAITSVVPEAHADRPRGTDAAAAEAAFREGRALMNAGDLERACAKLAESQRLDPAAGTLLNLAECLEKRGLTASAWAFYLEAVEASAKRGRADWEKLAASKAEVLAKIVPRVTYEVAKAEVEGGLVLLQDGAAVGPNVAVPIDPGSHTIEASAPGRATWKKTFEARNGDKLRIAVAPQSIEPAAPAAAPETPKTLGPGDAGGQHEGSGIRFVGLGLAGVGVLGLGLGTYAGLTAMSKHDEAAGMCASYPERCPSDGSASRVNDEAKQFATVSTIGFIAGGALVIAGAVLFFTAPRGRQALNLTPSVGSGRALLTVDGRF